MAYRSMTLSEKKRLCRRICVVCAILAVLVVAAVIALRPVDGSAGSRATATDAAEGLIEVDGVKYVPKKNIETYMFMGIDNLDKVRKVTDYEGAGRCDVVMIMVRDLTDGTYKTLSIDRNTMVQQDSLEPDGTYIATSEAQLSLAHENGDGLEMSCENVVKSVSWLLGGQKIDGYAAVNMGAISIINHLAGGVTVTIEDDFSKVDPTMKKGETITLTDEQAVHFVHDRYDVGDETNTQRMKRQEMYKADLKNKLAAKCSEDNKYPLTIYDSLGDYMVTSLGAQKFSKLALMVLQEKDNGSAHIDGTETTSDLGFVEFHPDEESLQKTIVDLFYREYK